MAAVAGRGVVCYVGGMGDGRRFAGVFAPVPTPFRADGGVDRDGLARNLEWWMATPLAGALVLGSNGEAPLLEEPEADEIIEVARAAVPADRSLIAGTGRASTAATVEATRRAFDRGADAALIVPPHFYRARMTPDALRRHYAAVADAADGPLLLYNVPAHTVLELPVSLVAEIGGHPAVAGIKDSSGDVGRIQAMAALAPSGFAVLTGSAPVLHASLVAGAVGAIVAVACVAPRECCALLQAAGTGDHGRASALQQRLAPLARAVTVEHGVPGLKAVLDRMGLRGGAPRPPLLPLGATAAAAVDKLWEDFRGAI